MVFIILSQYNPYISWFSSLYAYIHRWKSRKPLRSDVQLCSSAAPCLQDFSHGLNRGLGTTWSTTDMCVYICISIYIYILFMYWLCLSINMAWWYIYIIYLYLCIIYRYFLFLYTWFELIVCLVIATGIFAKSRRLPASHGYVHLQSSRLGYSQYIYIYSLGENQFPGASPIDVHMFRTIQFGDFRSPFHARP